MREIKKAMLHGCLFIQMSSYYIKHISYGKQEEGFKEKLKCGQYWIRTSDFTNVNRAL
jgi:hypothetical protein